MPAADTERNQEFLEHIGLISVALHQISHDLHALRIAVDKVAPLAEAYQRGGLLAMRTARKANGGKVHRDPAN